MATGLNASLKSFTSGTVISSSDVNANFSALNNAANPTFTLVTTTGIVGTGGGSVLRFGVYDTTSSGLGSYNAAIYVGNTDPTTIGGLTINNGDLWFDA